MDFTFLVVKDRENLAAMLEIVENVVSRKGALRQMYSNRTANRHRWTSVSMLK